MRWVLLLVIVHREIFLLDSLVGLEIFEYSDCIWWRWLVFIFGLLVYFGGARYEYRWFAKYQNIKARLRFDVENSRRILPINLLYTIKMTEQIKTLFNVVGRTVILNEFGISIPFLLENFEISYSLLLRIYHLEMLVLNLP